MFDGCDYWTDLCFMFSGGRLMYMVWTVMYTEVDSKSQALISIL